MTQNSFANRVMYDGLYTFVLRLLNVAFAAGLGILTARLLGPTGKGLYALPAVEAGLVTSAFGGLGSATTYFLLNRRAGSRVLWAAFCAASAFVLVGALAVIPIAFFAGQRWAALPAILSLPAAAAINFVCGYAVGIKRVRYSTSFSVALTLVTFALMAAGLFFVARDASVAIAAWLSASYAVALGGLAWVAIHARGFKGEERVGPLEFTRFSVKVGLVNLVSLLNYRADLYLVALLTSPASLGMYTVAVSAAESLLVPTQVTALVTSPHIGSLERHAAANLAARCVRNNMVIAAVVCGLLFAFAHIIVNLLYGPAFLPAVPVLQVLLIGVLAMSLGSPMSSYFTLKLGRPEVALWLASSSAVICIAVSIALIPRIGMLGAAVASTVAYIAGQTAATVYFARVTGTGIRMLLVPTAEDFAMYAAFARRLLADGRQLLHSSPTGR